MNILEAFGVTVLLISLMILAAKFLGRVKSDLIETASTGVKLFSAALIITFIIY